MLTSLRSMLSRHFTHLVLFISAILLMITALNFFYLFDVTAQSNDECLWRDSNIKSKTNIIYFDLVKVDGVTWNAGIRNGDRLVSINGELAVNTLVASKSLDKLSAGEFATYVVERNGKQFTTKVYIKKLVAFNNLAFTLLSSFWLIVGFFVLMAKPDGKIQRLFYSVGAFSVLFSMNSLLTRGQQVDNPILKNVFLLISVDVLIVLGGIFWAFSMIRFFSVFPIESTFERKNWIRRTLIYFPWILFILMMIVRVKFIYFANSRLAQNITGNIIGSLVFGSLMVSFLQLVFSYKKIQTVNEKRALRIILAAYIIGLSAVFYFILFNATTNQVVFNDPVLFMPIILIAIIPIAFGFAIFKYALMDIREAVKSTIIYGTATVSIAAVYFVIMLLLGQVVSSAIGTQYQGAIAGFVFVVFAIVFQSTKDHFQDYLTQKFYPEQFAFQKGLLKFSGDIAKVVGLDNILKSTKELYVDSLRIGKYGMMLKRNDGLFHLVQLHGIKHIDSQEIDSEVFVKYLIDRKEKNKRIVLERQNFSGILGEKSKNFIDEGIFTIIPLLINDQLIGILLFGLKQTGSQFDGKDLDLLISAANQTAISIENARLYDSEIEKKRLERDLENARHIQRSLLPKSLPSFENFELSGIMKPAQHVGGDYYDFIKVSDTKLFAIVGDVSGKGLSAALYMSKLQTMIRLYCTEEKSPKEILTEINRKLFGDMERNYFITATLAMIDTKLRVVKLCRAGHPSTLLFKNGKCVKLKSSGIGLGLDKGENFDSSLEELEIKAEPNDLFAIYSDGISEAMNPKQEEFGEDRIVRSIETNAYSSVDLVQEKMLAEVDSFCDGAEQHDDITLSLFKFL